MRLEHAQVTWSELRVGLLVLISIALLILMLMVITGDSGWFSRKAEIEVILPHAKGLKKGDAVIFAGLEVGSVRNVRLLLDAQQPSILLSLEIRRSLLRHIHRDGSVAVHGAGLTPTRYVEILPGSADAPLLQPGARLQGYAVPGFDNLLSDLEQVSQQLQILLDTSTVLLAQIAEGEGTLGKLWNDPSLYQNLNRATKQTAAVTQQLREGEGLASQLLNDAAIPQEVAQTVQALRAFSQQLNQGAVGTLVRDPSLHRDLVQLMNQWIEISRTLRQNSEQLTSLLTDLEMVVSQINEGRGSLGQLVREPTLHERFTQAADEVAGLAREARQGEGVLPRLLKDPQIAEDLAEGIEAGSEVARKLNTPGSTLDRLATDDSLYESLVHLSQGFEQLLDQIQQNEGTVATLVNDPELPAQLREFIEELHRLLTDIQAHPDRYVHFSLF